jgi:hypothetical protein
VSNSSARLQFVSGADELSLGAQLAEVAARKHIADITIAITGAGRRLFFAVGPDGRCLDRSVAQATLNPVGCLVKPLTAMLIAEAVAQTQLGWHDEIAEILGSRDVIGTRLAGVTVQQLLNHTHGLDASSIQTVPRTEDGCIDAAALCEALSARPLSVPGDLYSYSDAGGWLAGAVLEKLYHQPYLHILLARPFMRASCALSVPEGQVCASTGGALRLSASQWLEFLDTHAEQISTLGAERISLPGWGLFEHGASSGWKAYADGWLGHNSNQPDGSAVLRFHPRERVGIFVYAAGDAAMLALAGVLGNAFPELLHFRIPRPLAQRDLSPLKSDRYTGHFSRCNTWLAVQGGDGAPLSVSVHDPQAGPVWSCPHLRPGKDELFVPEPQDDLRFPFMQFLRPDASDRFEYVWNGRQLWRRGEPAGSCKKGVCQPTQ